MPKIKVDGQEIEAPGNKKLLEVLLDRGYQVPYYCWHPALKPAGNCRMCLVKVSNSRKMEVSCSWAVTEGLEVTTQGPDVEAARKSVLEYMLINHPLDCPVCDKAGECMLQDNTYDHRHGVSRFQDDKVTKGTKELGPNINIWGNRCIACTRCVRFAEDVVGTGELSIVNRGDHSVADVHPEIPLDNPMSLNVVDICPVGALIDKNFLFQARVWFAERKETVCTGCSRGCNTTATVYKGEVKRFQPRPNEDVNGYWMCDEGRLGLKWMTSDARSKAGKGSADDVVAAMRASMAKGHGRIALVSSTGATNEELHLLHQLADATGAKVAFFGKAGARWQSKSGFVIEGDRTANRAGAERVFGALADASTLSGPLSRGEIDVLVVVNAVPSPDLDAAFAGAAASAPFLAVADVLDNALTARAHVVFASAGPTEKEGTVVNRDGRLQRIRKLVAPPGAARPDVAWLQEVLVGLGRRKSALSAEGLFREAFPGLDFQKVGARGVHLADALASTPTVLAGVTA
jgi:NADH-quinone oxidoreductase subunit G